MGTVNHVSFPKLGLDFTFCETIKIPFLNVNIYWYAIIIALGLFTAICIAFYEFKKHEKNSNDLIDFLLFAVPLGILGARAYYVIFEWGYYSQHPDKIIAIWEGGLAIYGGVIVGIIVAIIWSKIKKIPFLWFADIATCGLFIAQSMGRWGNFINAEAFGSLTNLPWGMVVEGPFVRPTSPYGPCHPTFLYESLWNFSGFIISYFVIRRFTKTNGNSFAFYLIWYGMGRFFIEGLRMDSLYLIPGVVRISQVVAVLSVLVGISTLVFVKMAKKRKNLQVEDGNVTI